MQSAYMFGGDARGQPHRNSSRLVDCLETPKQNGEETKALQALDHPTYLIKPSVNGKKREVKRPLYNGN